MVSEEPSVVGVLNELLEREQQFIVHRIGESTAFVSGACLHEHDVVQRLAALSREHMERLANLILDSGGTPAIRSGNIASGDLHFQGLFAILPRLIQGQEDLIDAYKRASLLAGSHPAASPLIGDITANHHAFLAQLREAVQSAQAYRSTAG